MHQLMLVLIHLSNDPAESAGSTGVINLTYPLFIRVLLAAMTCLAGLVAAAVAYNTVEPTQRRSVAIGRAGAAFAAAVGICGVLLMVVLG